MVRANDALCVTSEIETIHVGWFMDYDNRATLAGIESTEFFNKDNLYQHQKRLHNDEQ